MSSTFETRFKQIAVQNELSTFGENVTYTPAGGSAKTIKAIINKDTLESTFNTGTSLKNFDILEVFISARSNTEGQVTVSVRNKDAVVGVSNGDTIVINSVTYYVRKIISNNEAGLHKLLVSTTGGLIEGLK
jgi:hypothetical protein